ncbi:response regulator transcription factor [Streptomyces sp. UNOC14_S4]|uniref:response regulator transcription factor n=1 Tax=Streptomyces sp. UNOC14_S4 TaxID=2872340 RepID=UPI001E55C97C|nr:LuxR C-terminal-related transcriptional regulator [Streptomyces sp. UNOC14_S4]MCC3769528.1 LuxR C-terminal-related transcriptional regulator [Streptomyces sp. UNOC14_S4]
MSQFHAHEYERMLDLAVAILECDEPESLRHLIAERLLEAFGCGTVIFARLDAPRRIVRRGQADGWAPTSLGSSIEGLVQRRAEQQHPLLTYLAEGGQTPVTMYRLCDHWRNTQCYSEAHRDFGTTQQLGIPLPAEGDVLRAVSLGREGSDFSDRELDFAARVRPLIVSSDKHVRELLRLRASVPPPADPVASAVQIGLTPREQTVLGLLAEGLTAGGIGRRLAISPHTVNRYTEKIYRKMGTNNRVSTVVLARQAGLVP